MADLNGVVVARDDGVIVILDAIPIPADTQQQLDALCDLLGVPARNEQTESEQP